MGGGWRKWKSSLTLTESMKFIDFVLVEHILVEFVPRGLFSPLVNCTCTSNLYYKYKYNYKSQVQVQVQLQVKIHTISLFSDCLTFL